MSSGIVLFGSDQQAVLRALLGGPHGEGNGGSGSSSSSSSSSGGGGGGGGKAGTQLSAEQAMLRLHQRLATSPDLLAQQLRRLLSIPKWQNVLVAPLLDEVPFHSSQLFLSISHPSNSRRALTFMHRRATW